MLQWAKRVEDGLFDDGGSWSVSLVRCAIVSELTRDENSKSEVSICTRTESIVHGSPPRVTHGALPFVEDLCYNTN